MCWLNIRAPSRTDSSVSTEMGPISTLPKIPTIQNVKLGANNIEVILCIISKSGLPLFCLVVPTTINLNSECTAFCTILEALDVGTVRGVVNHPMHGHTPCHQDTPK